MAQELDFSRSVYKKLATKKGRLFDAIVDLARSDSAAVNFTGKAMVMTIYTDQGGSVEVTLTVGTEIVISTARLIFNRILTELNYRTYYYEIHNDTDKIGTAHGPFQVK